MQRKVPIVCMTAYDYPTGLAVRASGADICLVGDSLANVALGYESTRALPLEQMIYHTQAVRRAIHASELQMDAQCPREPLLVMDMPFGTYCISVEDSVRAVTRVVRETQTAAVKLEGSHELVPLIKKLTEYGISVMGHIGLQPQRFGDASGLRVQGTTAESAFEIYKAAHALQEAGCFSMVIECVPAKVSEVISQSLRVPTIGIGAGSHTHGQVLVGSDVVGDLESPSHVSDALRATPATVDAGALPTNWPAPPKFVRSFTPWSLGAMRVHAYSQFADAVRAGTFPKNATEAYRIKTEELQRLHTLIAAWKP